MNIKFSWAKNFDSKVKKTLKNAQKCVDSECIEKMTEFVPVGLPRYRNAGKLRDSVKIKEAGKIIYTAPFAKHDYYSEVNHENGGNPNASRLWFEVMKSKYKKEILQDVSEITRGTFK